MERLNDIQGYYDMSYSYNFNDYNMWEGKILLEDDGWFEGIVADPHSSYTEDRFVFGIYHPGKVIELYKFTPINVTSPFVFHGSRDTKGYEGEFEVIGLFGTTSCGVSHIITRDAEASRVEVQELRTKIQRYKDSIMDTVGREFYNNTIAMRNSMSQIILRNYEGGGFTNEETVAIMDECQPVNERVVSSTIDTVRKLVRKKPEELLFGGTDDDDLPF